MFLQSRRDGNPTYGTVSHMTRPGPKKHVLDTVASSGCLQDHQNDAARCQLFAQLRSRSPWLEAWTTSLSGNYFICYFCRMQKDTQWFWMIMCSPSLCYPHVAWGHSLWTSDICSQTLTTSMKIIEHPFVDIVCHCYGHFHEMEPWCHWRRTLIFASNSSDYMCYPSCLFHQGS
jgi:hypothetical protein